MPLPLSTIRPGVRVPRPRECVRNLYLRGGVMQNRKRCNALLIALAAVGIGTAGSAFAAAGVDAGGVTAKGKFNKDGKQSKETIAARQKFFGVDNVNPRTGAVRNDRVIMSWVG